ncbi:MAG TPA: hypothetical protein PLI45_00240 [Candidatus Woesebacteria bacterium]|nr:hypothetical protein [Candidatus Woesebacteria bacterium]
MINQSKNNIKTIITVLVLVILGEGVLGWGLYWPFLLALLNWRGVYWLAFGVGILISVLRGMSIGLPSLFILVVVGGLSLLLNARKEVSWVLIVIGAVASIVFDMVFGLDWSIWEVIAVLIAGVVAVSWFERSETIRINY